MPRPNQARTIGAEEHLRQEIVRRRTEMRWSCADVAALMSDNGCAINQTAVWKIENQSRRITVDELIALARVFRVSPSELLVGA